jgi:hypothetical protein
VNVIAILINNKYKKNIACKYALIWRYRYNVGKCAVVIHNEPLEIKLSRGPFMLGDKIF